MPRSLLLMSLMVLVSLVGLLKDFQVCVLYSNGVGRYPKIKIRLIYNFPIIMTVTCHHPYYGTLSSTGAPPNCSCRASSTTQLNLTCSLVYSDASNQPINAKMTWTANGNVIKADDIPVRMLNNGYYTSTSFVVVSASGPPTYTCNVTFTKATAQFPYIATNAPKFSAICDVTGESKMSNTGQCILLLAS